MPQRFHLSNLWKGHKCEVTPLATSGTLYYQTVQVQTGHSIRNVWCYQALSDTVKSVQHKVVISRLQYAVKVSRHTYSTQVYLTFLTWHEFISSALPNDSNLLQLNWTHLILHSTPALLTYLIPPHPIQHSISNAQTDYMKKTLVPIR